jgi:hypothetical protein
MANLPHAAEHRMYATLLAQPRSWVRFTSARVCHQFYRSRRLPAAPRNATVRRQATPDSATTTCYNEIRIMRIPMRSSIYEFS